MSCIYILCIITTALFDCSCSSTPEAFRLFCDRCFFKSRQRESECFSILLWRAFRDRGCRQCTEGMGMVHVNIFWSKPCMWEQSAGRYVSSPAACRRPIWVWRFTLASQSGPERPSVSLLPVLPSARPIYGQYEYSIVVQIIIWDASLSCQITSVWVSLKKVSLSLNDGLNW